MSSSAPRCSGFMSTERSAVTVPPLPGGAEELDRQFGEREMQARLFGAREDRTGFPASAALAARTAHTTMSSSGSGPTRNRSASASWSRLAAR